MVVVYKNISSPIKAKSLFDDLYKFNKGRGGQYKYVYEKRMKTGKYNVGLLKNEAKSVILRRL